MGLLDRIVVEERGNCPRYHPGIHATGFLVSPNLSYPEKNRVQTKHNDQHVNGVAPLANPEWILFIEGEKNVR